MQIRPEDLQRPDLVLLQNVLLDKVVEEEIERLIREGKGTSAYGPGGHLYYLVRE